MSAQTKRCPLADVPESIVSERLGPRRAAIRSGDAAFVVMGVGAGLISCSVEWIGDCEVFERSNRVPRQHSGNRLVQTAAVSGALRQAVLHRSTRNRPPMTLDLPRRQRCETDQFQPKSQQQPIRMVAGPRNQHLFAVSNRATTWWLALHTSKPSLRL